MARKKKEISEAIREAVKPKKRGRPTKEKPVIEFKEGLKDIENIETIAVADIDLDDRRFQYRLKEKAKDLIPSLTSDGQLVPVMLWGQEPPYKIVDGYRRVTAVKSLEWPSVRAIIQRDISEEDALRLSFVENVKRKNFSPLDMANALWKMQHKGKTNADLTKEFGLSERQINRYKALIQFSEPIKEALANETITMTHAQLFHTLDVKDIEPWVEQIKQGLHFKDLKRKIIEAQGEKKKTRQFFRKEKEGFRFFPFRFNNGLPTKEREHIKKILEQALELVNAGL